MDLAVLDRYENKESFVQEIKKLTFDIEVECHGCGQVLVYTFLKTLKIENPELLMAASPFFAGMALTGNTCGALLGGLMVLGLFHGRKDMAEHVPGLIKGVKPLRKFVQYFANQNNGLNCKELTGTDLADPQKAKAYFDAGGLQHCAGITAEAAGYIAALVYDQYQSQKASQAD